MTSEMIEKFVKQKNRKDIAVNVHFKDRDTVKGLFILGMDYEELKSKNFWRIVSSNCMKEWKQTNDVNLTRIFNGVSFTRLSDEQS
ncbi:MAG: short-chain dehydrogenase [Bacteroidota bacterium]|nr:short-chain dehydrogenase [Bacteroidota bacterium]